MRNEAIVKNRRKQIWAGVLLVCVLVVSGCGKEELTEDRIKATSVYQKLETNHAKLQRQYEKAVSAQDSSSVVTVSADAQALFTSIKKSVFVKAKYSEVGSGRYEFSENASLFAWLQGILCSPVLDSAIEASDWQAQQEALYEYILYNEDHTLCQIQVYDGDYVIYSSVPEQVYYVAGICRLGDGVFGNRNKIASPKRSLFAELYDCQIGYKDNAFQELRDIQSFALALSNVSSKHWSNKPSDVEIGSLHEYIFKGNGHTYVIEQYQQYLSVTKDGASVEWYGAENQQMEAAIKELKQQTQ